MHSSQLVRETAMRSLANARVLIQENLRDSDAWVLRALVVIFEYQTAEEQNTESTRDANGVGFSGIDGQIMTSFAKQVLRHQADPNPKFKSPLSERQMVICRNKIKKYSGQLARLVRAKEQARLRLEEAEARREQLLLEMEG